MDPFARGDGGQDQRPFTPPSGGADPAGAGNAEWTSPPPPADPTPTGFAPFGDDEAAARGLGEPPPEWSGYYTYPSQRYATSDTGGGYGRCDDRYPPYPGTPAYWTPPPPASRRGSRPLLVAVAVIACIALLAAGVGGGVRAALFLRGLNRPAQAHARGGTGAGLGRAGTVNLHTLAGKLDPSVVDITGVKDDAVGQTVEQDAGTGVIVTKSGAVLTNNHVIEGDTQLQATLASGASYPIKVLGEDPADDLALVQIQGPSHLPMISMRSAAGATMGESVAAFGNALGRGGQPAATQGQVTHLGQTITATLDGGSQRTETLTGLIEVTAQICPGDSGGILADARGDYLGILTAASTPSSGGGYGGGGSGQQQCSSDGFVIPIAHAIPIVRQIRSGRRSPKVIIGLPGFLGVEVQECTEASAQQGSCQAPAVNGAQITQLVEGGAAERAGFPQAFIITAIGGTQITSPTELTTALEQTSPGQAVQVTWNDGQGGPSQTTSVTLGAGPPA